MSLLKCTECGHEVSDKAKNCPKCGAPVRKKSKFGCFSVSILIILFLVAINQIPDHIEEQERNKKSYENEQVAAKLENEKLAKRNLEEKKFVAAIEGHYQKVLNHFENKRYEEAFQGALEFERYGQREYKDIKEIKRLSRINFLENKVKDIPKAQYFENLTIYIELKTLDPENQKYQEKTHYYATALKKQSEKEKSQRTKSTNSYLPSIVHPGQLKNYADKITKNGVVNVCKLNGKIDEREDDLKQLCLDWYFYRKMIAKYHQENNSKKLRESQVGFQRINQWLNDYHQDDVSVMLSLIEQAGW
jgi:hypothetical protein